MKAKIKKFIEYAANTSEHSILYGTTYTSDYSAILTEYMLIILYEPLDMEMNPMDKFKYKLDEISNLSMDRELEIPVDLKAQITELCGRKKDRCVYSWGVDVSLPRVNARYLQHILETFNVKQIKFTHNKAPVQFISDEAMVYLLPCYYANAKEKGVYLA